MATTTSLNSVLKTKYSDRIEYQLNDEGNLLKLFKNAIWDWYGLQIHVPVHVSRNDGIQAIPFGGNYRTAGDQGYNNLIVTAALLTGHIYIPRSEMKRAKEKGYGAFVSWWDAEFKRTMVDVKFRANRYLLAGNRFKGFITNRNGGGAGNTGNNSTGACTVAAPAAGTDTKDYFGDMSAFDGSDENPVAVGTGPAPIVSNSWVRIRVFRLDTLAEVLTTGGIANPAIWVSAFDATARTIDVSVTANLAAESLDLNIAGMPAGQIFGVALSPTAYLDSTGAPFGALTSFANQPQGVFGNLCEPVHFGIDRTTATNTAVVLQCDALFMQANDAVGARAAVTPARVQHCMDQAFVDGGEEIDCILISPLTRAAYLAIMTGTLTANVESAGGKGDAAYSSLAFAGMKLKVSQHVPPGGWIFLKRSSWKIAEMSKCEFVDDDGSIIHRVSGTSAFEAAIEWYYNFVCLKPRCNAILAGTALA